MRFAPCTTLAAVLAFNLVQSTLGDDVAAEKQSAAENGRKALFERCFSSSLATRDGYENLWKQWGLSQKPADYETAVRDRYGLHSAAYPNDGFPMGLRHKDGRMGASVGIDCMLCHAGSMFGKSHVGLPNTSLDLALLFQEMGKTRGVHRMLPYHVSNVRGTTEATATAIFLISFRDADLNRRWPIDLGGVPDRMCEDAPAWWLLKKKRTMYSNGQIDSRSVRPLMAFMMGPLTDATQFRKLEPVFADIREFILTIQPPKYPFPIDDKLAARGKDIFASTCVRCHGKHGPGGDYPNKIVPIEEIGTDATVIRSLRPEVEEHYRNSWLGRSPGPDGQPYELRYNQGYQAPPLDGVWATAPYFHNGSVPTLHHVLQSAERPKLYTRSYRTEINDFDQSNVGWKVTELSEKPSGLTPADERAIYDTTQIGRGNSGHIYGDLLSDSDRRALIEYLKSL